MKSLSKLKLCVLGFSIFCLHAYADTNQKNSNDRQLPKFIPGTCPKVAGIEKTLAKARCGYLIVPENRSKKSSPAIQLAVTIIPAQIEKARSDPIVYMVGGPGGSALPGAEMLVQAGLNKERDLIIMDQRGTTYSKPALLCPEVDRFNTEAVTMPYDADKTRELHLKATQACYERLKATGVDLAAYNTMENAADFADLRNALNIPEWNIYGVSYGTNLALTYMTHHPEGIRTVTIDSVVPTNKVTLGTFWMNAAVGLNNIFNACKADPQCRKRYPDLKKTFVNLVNQLEKKPIEGNVTPVMVPGDQPKPGAKNTKVVLDGGAFVNWAIGVTEMLGPDLPSHLEDVLKDKPNQVLASYAASGQAHSGDYSYGLHNTVVCSEWIPYESAEAIIKTGQQVFPKLPKSVLAQSPQFPFAHDDCKIWQVLKAPASQRQVKAKIPTLIISGSYDAITSPKTALDVAQVLPKSIFVVIPGVGHYVVPKSECAQQIMASFLQDPSKINKSCLDNLRVPKFKLGQESAKSYAASFGGQLSERATKMT